MERTEKKTVEEVVSHGNIDAQYVLDHPEMFHEKSIRTAKQHAQRYQFAKRFVKDKHVLDIACGTGYGSRILDVHSYASYIGVDIDPDSIELAKERYAPNNPRAVFFTDDATSLRHTPIPSESIDVAISFETIEHTPFYRDFLKHMHDKLKKDGLFIVSTPNRDVTHPGTDFSHKPTWDFHTQEWVLEEFLALLDEEKFSPVQIYAQSFRAHKLFGFNIPGLGRILRHLSLTVVPWNLFRFFGKANFYILVCKKK